MRAIRIGAGSAFGGDRIDPAVELAEKGDLDYLVFECLAERTIALAQLARMKDPELGYDRLLEERMSAVLPPCARRGIKIISNMGAANPAGAAKAITGIAAGLGLTGLKIAYVLGDDVLELVQASDYPLTERQGRVRDIAPAIVSANAYIGMEPIVEALGKGADVVITGRCGDPALFVAPMVHEFGWKLDDWNLIGQGTLLGHLLECTGQLTGGYFADPGYKDVADLARIGFPIAEISADGSAVVTKVEGSGGVVSVQTCKEQLLYEVHDPASYLQPDVIADFSQVRFTEQAADRVAVSGGAGRARPETLKVTIGYSDGFIGEGQISYCGSGAVNRAQLALAIAEERLRLRGIPIAELRSEIIGINSSLRGKALDAASEPLDVRARIAGRAATLRDAEQIGREVETLWIHGPAGGGGATWSSREVIAAASTLLPRDLVKTSVHYLVS